MDINKHSVYHRHLIKEATKCFEEELSGEPLTQDAVIEGMVKFHLSMFEVNKRIRNISENEGIPTIIVMRRELDNLID